MADDIAGQLLGRDQVSSWCGDLDMTGRYVCTRIRNHALDWHAGRNDAGGIHQWKAQGVDGDPENTPAAIPATDPAGYPIGTVVVHPDDDRMSPAARRRVCVDASDYCGPYEGCRWQRLTGLGIYDGGCDPIHSDAVVGWPVQPLAELAVVLGHEQDAEIQRLQRTNESLLAMLERMETLHVTWRGPGNEEFHPDWCRECRVDKVAAELAHLESQRDAWWNQRAAELAEVRASREAWAIEADRLDAELKERPTAWAYEQADRALEKRRVALVEALGARPGAGFYDSVDDVAELVRDRAALSGMLRGMARRASAMRRALRARPAIPADAEEGTFGQRCEELGRIPAGRYYLTSGVEVGDNREVVSRFDIPGGVRIAGFWPSHKARIEPAPVSGSDTTADGGPR